MVKNLLQDRWPWWLAAAGILGWLAYQSIEITPPIQDNRPPGGVEDVLALAERDDVNVLFILIDTLRADRLGAYGYHRDTSPNLDDLISTGVRFERHLAQSSWTKASMASMWTGLYPTHTGITRYDHVIPESARMPAEVFSEAGFDTVGFYRNGWVAPTFGFEQGFDVYSRPPRRRVNAQIRAENPTISNAGTDQDTIVSAVEYMRVHASGKRWFLYAHLMDIHEYLYDIETAVFGGTYPDKYDNSILWTDGSLEILFDYMRSFGLDDNTIVVIASDHGEAFRERGLEGHARAVYRESTEVPFAIVFPFTLGPDVTVPSRTENVDIWPTLYELVGIESDARVDGRSRVPEILAALSGETPPGDDDAPAIAFLDDTWGRRSSQPNPRIAVVDGPHRYLRTPGPRHPDGVLEELFDASSDPAELTDVSKDEDEADRMARLRAIAEEHLAAEPAWGDAPTRALDELELNQLRALGYAIP